MMRSVSATLLAILISAAPLALSQQTDSPASQPAAPIVIPAGYTLELVNTRVVWMKSVRPGNLLYLQTQSSLMVDAVTAIPSGTYVKATLTAFTLPTKKTDQATLHIRFDKLIFPNGYTVTLGTNTQPAPMALVTVNVSSTYDLVLDNGTQLDMPLSSPLTLDAQRVAQAVPLATVPGPFLPGTLCRDTPFIPGTPGSPGTPSSPDITIPGSPGTPDTVIPGTDGSPDIVIPGMPATPDTVIPGNPGTPDDPGTPDTPATYCPPPPVVISSIPA